MFCALLHSSVVWSALGCLGMADVCLLRESSAICSTVAKEAVALSVVLADAVSAAVHWASVVKLVAEVDRVRTGQVVSIFDCSLWGELLACVVASHPFVVVFDEENVVLVAVWNQAFGDSKLLIIVHSFEVEASRVSAVNISG